MNIKSLLYLVLIAGVVPCHGDAMHQSKKSDKMTIKIMMGSTREGRSSDAIARAVKNCVVDRTDVNLELLDLRDYPLDLLNDRVNPSVRKKITDPAQQKWADAVTAADAFIIVVPVYNEGYPAVLKNALDVLYVEWHGKPVGFVSYSGKPTGGVDVVEQLRRVAEELRMVPVATSIAIPSAWKAFDQKGLLSNIAEVTDKMNCMIDELKAAKA